MHKSSPAKIWRKFNSRYKLTGVKCSDCKAEYFPAVKLCIKCYGADLAPLKIDPEATLISWSLVNATLDGFEEFAPVIIAIVELKNKIRFTTQLTDVIEASLEKGIILKPTFRKIFAAGETGVIHYGLKYTV